MIEFNYKTALLKIEVNDKRQKAKEKKNLANNYKVDVVSAN